ncbi:MAG: OmpH family outer membrane protein [Pyrinomonadaceae bacterium]|nr:OmpH family outer membrane protein [Pyrinomonadaceae bacterium]
MKLIKFLAFNFIFASIFAVAVMAQAPQTGKIAVINTKAFEADKTGIQRYINGFLSVDKEFEPVNNELRNLVTKRDNLEKEIRALQEQAQKNPNVPIKPETINAKADEYERLGREIKYKQEDAKARYDRRQQDVLNPILADIGKAMDEFANQKGYSVILDGSKLDQAGVILALSKTADVTDEFIKFYNARPAGTATTKP